MSGNGSQIISLNVGGSIHSTTQETLTKEPNSTLAKWFNNLDSCPLAKDPQGNYFVDRDGQVFRYLLDYLRAYPTKNSSITGAAMSEEISSRILQEAKYYGLYGLEMLISGDTIPISVNEISISPKSDSKFAVEPRPWGYITVGYHGTFSFGRQGIAADVNFRKIAKILICGRVSLCREVFGDTLNEGRDPDRGSDDRYTSRFFLKHNVLEQAFDALHAAGFNMSCSCASGTNGASPEAAKPGSNVEEDRWAHYNEFIFYRAK